MEPTRYLKDISHLGINEYHSPSYHRINNSNNIYDYLYGNVGVSGKHSLPFHQAVNSIDNAGEKMYKRNFNYRNMLRFDKKYNLDDRILEYANDRLMSEWKNIDNDFQKAQQSYESGNITENKFNRLSKKYERNAERYNEYANNLNNNAKHFNIANSINNGRSIVTGKGPLYDSMTKGTLGLIGAGIGAGFASEILPKVATVGWKILSHPIVQTIGTIDGIRNLVTDNGVNKTINHFNNEEYGKGSLSLLGDVLDASPLIGGSKAIYKGGKALYNGSNIHDVSKNLWKYTDIGRWLSAENRAKYAYVTISPEGYNRPFKRGFDFIKSWALDKPININNPNWKLSDNLLVYIPEWIGSTPADRLKVAHMGREDAWRIYNRLTPRHGIYISNPNGTYSYNLDRIKSILHTPEELVEPLHWHNKIDYLTGAHGNLWTISQDIPGQSHGNKINYMQHIEDMWDIHPFSRSKDNFGEKLVNKYENLRGKFYNAINKVTPKKLLYDKDAYDKDMKLFFDSISSDQQEFLEPPYLSDYIRNKWLWNKTQYRYKNINDYPLFKWIDNKMKNFEIGTITGGKPFKLEMDIPYHVEIEPSIITESMDDGIIDIKRGFMDDVIEPLQQSDIKFKINPFNSNNINLNPDIYINPQNKFKSGGK